MSVAGHFRKSALVEVCFAPISGRHQLGHAWLKGAKTGSRRGLFDHLIGNGQEVRRDIQSKELGRLQVDQ